MDELNEYLLEAREELKRLEHIIYVSLKYSRTVDVIENALNRLVSIWQQIIHAFLEKAIEEDKLAAIPKSPARAARILGDLYPEDKELQKYLTFYHFLKTVLNTPQTRRQEYRRHVTLMVELEKSTAEMCIDNLENCENFAHKFLAFAKEKIEGVVPEED